MKVHYVVWLLTYWLCLTLWGTDKTAGDVAELRAKSEKGDAKAAYTLGLMYATGTGGVFQLEDEALRLLRLSAKGGYASAKEALKNLMNGQPVTRKTSKISDSEWIAKLLKNEPLDKIKIIREVFLRTLKRLPTNPEKALALKHWEKARSSKEALEDILWSVKETKEYKYIQNNKTDEEETKPLPKDFSALKALAEKGGAKAQFALGEKYRSGEGVEKDFKEAINWYRKAARQKHPKAQYNLGYMYDHGEGMEEDDEEAVKWYRKAAEQGDHDAQISLGSMYEYGHGVEKDLKEAVKWYRKAAEQNAESAFKLGSKFYDGRGVKKDFKEALKLYLKSAEEGFASAQCNLGMMYLNGEEVEKDAKKAVKWFRKAAEQNNPRGQTNLGHMYSKGNGVEKDHKEAIMWFRKAAEQNDPDAQYELCVMYWSGNGLEKNVAQAYLWVSLAAAQEHELAKKYKPIIKITLKPEEIRKVEKWIKEWSVWKLARGWPENPADFNPFAALKKKYGIQVHWREGDILGPKYDHGEAKEVGQLALQQLPDILGKALAKYPPWVIQKHLNHVRFAEDLSFDDKEEFAGTVDHKTKSIYVETAAKDKARTSVEIENIIHHEFATFLMKVNDFPTNAWINCNPPDFKYEDPEGRGYNVLGKDWGPAKKFWPLGFVRGYSQASLDNDFENLSGLLFADPRKAKLLIDHYPKLKEKYRLWLKVHQKIDDKFYTEDRIFRKGLFDPGLPNPKAVKQDELFDLNGTYVYKLSGNPYSGRGESHHDNGKLCSLGVYKDGKLLNRFVYKWHPNGRRESEFKFWEGKIDGIQQSWHDNGQQQSLTNYQDDQKEGKSTFWHKNGKKKAEENYKKGMLDGNQTHWNDKGQLELEADFKAGKETARTLFEWHPNGKQKSEASVRNGKQDGPQKTWYDNGSKKLEAQYRDGEIEGIRREWHDNGKQKFEINYRKGKQDGILKAWYDNGSKKLEAQYRDGEVVKDTIKRWDRDETPK